MTEEYVVKTEKKKKPNYLLWAIIIIVLIIVYTQIGLFTIQPIGAIPDGITLLVLRSPGRPFLDSADRMCIDTLEHVSLLCRGMAMGTVVEEYTIILRLPYMEWAYLGSTNGMTYE